MDVRAQVRWNSRPRIRHPRRRQARYPQQQGQGKAISRDRYGAEKTRYPGEAITCSRWRDSRVDRWPAGKISGAAKPHARERVAPDRATYVVDARGADSLRYPGGRKLDPNA